MGPTLIYLQQICDQLTEVLGLKDNLKVCALIDEDIEPHKVQGWSVVRLSPDGSINPINNKHYCTIKGLLDDYKEK